MDGTIPVPGPSAPFQPPVTARVLLGRIGLGVMAVILIVVIYTVMFGGV